MKPLVRGGPDLLDGRRLLKVSTARQIDGDPATIWDIISDHTTWTAWHEDYDEHEAITAQTRGMGASFTTKEWVLRSQVEVVRWDEGTQLGWTILRATGLRWLIRSYYSELTIEPIDDRPAACRVSYRVAFTGTAIFWLLSAYTVGHSLASIYLDARSSLQKLDDHATAHRSGDGG